MTAYLDFIARKLVTAPPTGISRDVDLNPRLFPFQQDLVRWALRRGRAALFEDCGLGKCFQSHEWARAVVEETNGSVLMLAPLAVAKQAVREAGKFGIEARYCRSQGEVRKGINVANYEMLPHFDPGAFKGVVLDESSILKSLDGRTRTALIEAFRQTPYRLCCSATPAPNDHMELGNHAEFLGIMSRAEMLSMFFVHDGGSTSDWRIKGHAEDTFWRWVCSWAAMVRRPSDLGYPDDAFVLPSLSMQEHVVTVDHHDAWASGMLFKMEAVTLEEQRAARRGTISKRVDKAAELALSHDRPFVAWCGLNAEGDAIEKAIPGAVQIAGSDSDEHKEEALLGFLDGKILRLVSKSSMLGFGVNMQCCADTAFVGIGHSFEQFYQTVRRFWRFGQAREVNAHIITAETEGRVVANLKRKEVDAQKMADGMLVHMRDIQRAEITGSVRVTTEYEPKMTMVIPRWLNESANEGE